MRCWSREMHHCGVLSCPGVGFPARCFWEATPGAGEGFVGSHWCVHGSAGYFMEASIRYIPMCPCAVNSSQLRLP